jgi:hypothetical protein
MNATTDNARRMITEEMPVAGHELLARVKTLLSEGRVRHIRVKSATGETYFEVPLAVGLIGGAALAFASPWLAMASALAGMVSSVKLEVVRDADVDAAASNGRQASPARPGRATAAKAKRTPARAASRTAKPTAKAANATRSRAASTPRSGTSARKPNAGSKRKAARR